MDFVTQTLMGVGIARIASPSRDKFSQCCLAGALGSLLPDADSWLVLMGPNAYGFYHRVFTHSIVGLVGTAVVAGTLAWVINKRPAWRRFGWFVAPNIRINTPPPSPVVLPALIWIAIAAAAAHWCADFITGFGNLKPMWPWSQREFTLGAVTSFDPFILLLTVAWHLLTRNFVMPRSREALLGACYALILSIYVVFRWHYGARTVW